MSYEVLARKWRPLTFDDVVGQSHITRTLKKAVETGRISHAYMLSGPRGCGKTSTARILARVINCENLPADGNPCNSCPSCEAVIRGNNLDVMEIDGASHTGVAEVRDLQESIGYTPSQFKNKVYIIDEVHMLSTQAFNALLKTLEEPPAHVYFIFATTAPHKIPDTIKSRCQRHHFKRLEIKEIAGQLEAICSAEKFEFEKEGLRLLARKADGSMRDGTSLLDQCVTSSGGNVTTEAVRDILGLIDQEKVLAFVERIAGGDTTEVLRLLDACIDEGLDIQELCSALLEGYRDLMLLATPGDLSDLLYWSKDEVDLFKKVLPNYELPDLVTIVERLCDAVPRLKTSADPRITLETLLVDLCMLDRQVDIRRLITDLEGSGPGQNSGGRKDRGRQAGESAPTQRKKETAGKDPSSSSASVLPEGQNGVMPDKLRAASPGKTDARTETASEPTGEESSQPVAGDGELDYEKLCELWDGFVTFVRQKKVSLGVCLISGRLHAFDGKTVTLRFMKNFGLQKDQVSNPANVKFLKQTFKKYFKQEVELDFLSDGEELAVKPTRKEPDQFRGVSPGKKPIVEKIIKEFDGEIVRYNR